MPKHLYLLRHAESMAKQIRQTDKERELSPSGVIECFQIGHYLSRTNIAFDMIFSSSAIRTRATTQLIADAIKFDPGKIIFEDSLYDASLDTFLEFISGIQDNLNSVMCVGHNPTISHLADYITKAETPDMVTGSLMIIKFNFSSWTELSQGKGEFINYIVPSSITGY